MVLKRVFLCYRSLTEYEIPVLTSYNKLLLRQKYEERGIKLIKKDKIPTGSGSRLKQHSCFIRLKTGCWGSITASRASHTQLNTEYQANAVRPYTLPPDYITNLHIYFRYCRDLCFPFVSARHPLEVTATSQQRSTYHRIYAILEITPPMTLNSSPHKNSDTHTV